MTDASVSTRRLSPKAKTALGIFARYATIIGLLVIPASLTESRKLCRKAFDELTAKALPAIT